MSRYDISSRTTTIALIGFRQFLIQARSIFSGFLRAFYVAKPLVEFSRQPTRLIHAGDQGPAFRAPRAEGPGQALVQGQQDLGSRGTRGTWGRPVDLSRQSPLHSSSAGHDAGLRAAAISKGGQTPFSHPHPRSHALAAKQQRCCKSSRNCRCRCRRQGSPRDSVGCAAAATCTRACA